MRLNKSFLFIALCFAISLDMFSQALTIRKTFKGQYDIRMVGSMVLQPAFVSSVSPVTITGFFTDDMMVRTGTEFSSNNRHNGFPGTGRNMPLNATNGCLVTDPCPAASATACPTTSTSALKYTVTSPTTAMVYADCDEDVKTFQSSWANLDFGADMACTTIQAAYLYWVGEGSTTTATYGVYNGSETMKSYLGGAVGNVNPSTYKTVKFKAPGDLDYSDVTATTVYPSTFSGTGAYICVADVTQKVKGKTGGRFWAANIQSTSKGSSGVASGWCLVVLFTPPNCPPRHIVLYDGMDGMTSDGQSRNVTLSGLVTPATSNFRSYLGLAVLDGENSGPETVGTSLLSKTVTKLDGTNVNISTYCDFETVDFTAGGPTVKINPFASDQPYYRMADKYGVPLALTPPTRADACNLTTYNNLDWKMGIDGVSSSRITTYLESTNTNGNNIERLPSLRNTLGFDAHHMRLPQGAITPNATSAKMTVYSGAQGGSTPFLAYIAIETLQPNLQLDKVSDKTTVDFASSRIGYTLKAVNRGGKAQNANEAYIVDTLDIPVASIENVTVPSTHKATLETGNYQTDPLTGRKYLKFIINDPLPAMSAITNQVASTDSLIIKFTAVLQDASYSQWKIRCRRNVKNQAWIHYKGDAGQDFVNASNGGACGQGNALAPVLVEDQAFLNIDLRYYITQNLTAEVEANPTIKIKDKLRTILNNEINPLNLPNTDINKFLYYDSNHLLLTGTEVFNPNNPVQTFTAEIDMGGVDCIEVYTFTIILGKVPTITLTPTAVSCNGLSTGSIAMAASEGGSTEIYRVSLYAGSYSSSSPVPLGATPILGPVNYNGGSATAVSLGTANGLVAGTYTAVAVATVNTSIPTLYKTVTITEPTAVTTSLPAISPACKGSSISLTATVTGGPVGGTKSCVWESSADGNTWTPITGSTTTISYTIDNTTYFKVTGNVNTCSATSSSIQVEALPTPVLETFVTDSACYAFDLHNYHAVETSGITSAYTTTLHYGLPTSATDNRFLISENNYLVKQNQKKPFKFGIEGPIWARMSVQDLCYGTGVTNIYIKDMEMCSPIIVSNFFSPDGDGLNDLFQINGLADYSNPQILIYDRFGKLLFSGNAASVTAPNGWDGTYLGRPLPSDDYWYAIKLTEVKDKIGHFTLKRRKE